MKQIRALSISRVGLPFQLDVSLTGMCRSGSVAETSGESAPRILFAALEGDRKPIHPHKAPVPRGGHGAPLGRARHTAARGLSAEGVAELSPVH